MQHSFQAPSFGTDGLRGEAGKPPLDPVTLRRIGAALGLWLQRSGPATKRVLCGHDGRASAPWILEALAKGLAATDATVADVGLTTTPALAYVTRTEPYAAGIMISASHNPASDNGIKIFEGNGHKLPDEGERAIERATLEVDVAEDRAPRVKDVSSLLDRYQEALANLFPRLDLGGTTLVVDAAHGGGSRLAPAVLRAFGATVIPTATTPDGHNINQDVGALHAAKLRDRVTAEGALLGVCLDGDGDRGIFVDDRGEVRDGDAVMALLGRQMHASGTLPHDTVVATVMSNLGLHRFLGDAGIRVHTTPVGDRAVVQAMRERGYALGGEQSGHIIFAEDGDYTGDGLLTALKLLSLPGFLDGSGEVFADFHRFPQLLRNVPVRSKPPLDELAEVQLAKHAVEQALGDDGRVVLRYSGTEDLCRVMVEGPDADVVAAHTATIVAAVERCLC